MLELFPKREPSFGPLLFPLSTGDHGAAAGQCEGVRAHAADELQGEGAKVQAVRSCGLKHVRARQPILRAAHTYVHLHILSATVVVEDPNVPKSFTFDDAFDDLSLQVDVYNTTARPIVESVLEGYNGE